MKLVNGVIIDKLENGYVAVATEEASELFNGMIKLNETAVFIVRKLMNEVSYKDLIQCVELEYSIDEVLAKAAVDSVLNELRKTGLLNE